MIARRSIRIEQRQLKRDSAQTSDMTDPQNKRPKLEQNEMPNEKSDEKPAEPTNITDLNNDCLEKIFELLDIQSLLNVTVSCNWLQVAAESVYKRKFNMKILLSNFRHEFVRIFSLKDNRGGNMIMVNGIRTCLQFLRCFGGNISNLEVQYNESSTGDQCTHIGQYISQYCASSLVELKLIHAKVLMENIEKPFSKLERLYISRSNVGKQFLQLAEWFPALRCLEILNSSGFRGKCAANITFSNLEYLVIGIDNTDRTNGFSQKNAEILLHQNPQLQTLKIEMPHRQGMSFSHFLDMIGESPTVSKLILSPGFVSYLADNEEMNRFAAAFPSLVELDMRRYRFTADVAIDFIRQKESLQSFRFILDDYETHDDFVTELGDQWNTSIIQLRNYVDPEMRRRNKWRKNTVRCVMQLNRQ